MPAAEFISAEEYGDIDAVAQLYTDSFAEYYSDGKLIPVMVTAQNLEDYLREEQMSLENCPVALVGGKPAGFATVGVRPEEGTAWCKGFGIVAEFRGARLGRSLAGEMKRRARSSGATRYMTLGCMKDNLSAIKTYEASGFIVAHECYSMQWSKPVAWTSTPVPQSLSIVEAEAPVLLSDAYDMLHQTSIPVWNRQRKSLAAMDGLLGLAVTKKAASSQPQYDSYALFRPSNDVLGATTGAVALLDLCGTIVGMEALLHVLQTRYDNLQVNSEADHSPALPCLRRAGFTVTHERLHMVSSLSDKSDIEELRNAVVRPPADPKL